MQTECSPVEIGDTVHIVPGANFDKSTGFADVLQRPIPATVIQINEANRWYRVEYRLPGCIGRECFKF